MINKRKQNSHLSTDVIVVLVSTEETKKYIDGLLNAIAHFRRCVLQRIKQYISLYHGFDKFEYRNKVSTNLQTTSTLDQWIDEFLTEYPDEDEYLCYVSSISLRGIASGIIDKIYRSNYYNLNEVIDKEMNDSGGDAHHMYRTFIYNDRSYDDPKINNITTLSKYKTKSKNNEDTRHIKSTANVIKNHINGNHMVDITLFGSIKLTGVTPYPFALPVNLGTRFNRYTVGKFGDIYYIRLPAWINIMPVKRRWVRSQVKHQDRNTLFVQPIINSAGSLTLELYWKDNGKKIFEDSVLVGNDVIDMINHRITTCYLANQPGQSYYHSLLSRSKEVEYLYSYIRYTNVTTLLYRTYSEIFGRIFRGLYLHDRVIVLDAIATDNQSPEIVQGVMYYLNSTMHTYSNQINCQFSLDADASQYTRDEKTVYRYIRRKLKNRYRK